MPTNQSPRAEIAPRRARGRPRGFDERAALEAAMLAFWRNGYQATSLDDIVTATGAARASVYKTFGDKRTLFLKALDLYGSRFDDRIDTVLADDMGAHNMIRHVLQLSVERLTGGEMPPGCLRCQSILGLSGTDPVLDRALADSNAKFEAAIQRIVDHGIGQGELDTVAANGLARYIAGAFNGMVTLARADATRQELEEYVDHVMAAWPAAPDVPVSS